MERDHIRVLIVDDSTIVRWALRVFLQEHGITTVGEATSPADAINLAAEHKPDLVLADLSVSDSLKVESATGVCCGHPVLAYGVSDSTRVERFLSAGGMGFLSRSAPIKDFVAAIRAVARGQRWVSSHTSSRRAAPGDLGSERVMLSGRERQVAALIARGLSSSQIASELFISLNTVETHRYRIFRKLGVHSRAELVDYALRSGLVDL